MKTLFKVFLSISILILGYGCSPKYTKSPEPPKALQGSTVSDHFIFIDKNGNMRDKDDNKIAKSDEMTEIENILSRFNSLRKERKDLSMIIFIHGGLNSFKNSVKRAKGTYKRVLSDGQYPIFISWQAGPWTNYWDHLFTIRKGERHSFKPSELTIKSLGAKLAIPFVLAEDILRAAARIPASYWNMITEQNPVAFRFFSKEEKVANASEAKIRKSALKCPEFKARDKCSAFIVHDRGPSTGHGFWDFATIGNPGKLISAPFADGLGKGTWRSMLRRTDLVLNSQAGYDGEGKEASETAVHYLLSELGGPEYSSVKKVLIGHSMGTIVANNILSRFPDIDFDTVVYMAAACKLKDLEKSVVPWLRGNEKREFYNLSLNPYREINEIGYFDFIPRGSLLIWIDGFLEDVNSFEDRTAGYWFNIMRGAEIIFPEDLRSRVHLTKFGIDREYCREGRPPKVPQTHGAFDDYNFWDDGFWRDDKDVVAPIIKGPIQPCPGTPEGPFIDASHAG
ncbi:MAG: hypothetical protein LGR52_10605 [Candidatus Thiosymbion ectosymbiont of Robbea hypermnestra]|nr:hypothetical protein [Candidatus Thiosymbion ectosymbiont of Robbea hypermnestra]